VCDGWITYGIPVVAGLMYRDSVEISELSYPIHYREMRLAPDTSGAGRFRGAPALCMTYGPSGNPMTVVFAADGQTRPARGVRGGNDGNVGRMDLIDEQGIEKQMLNVGQVEMRPGQWLRGLDTGGGGYGDPLTRDPDQVRLDVLERYVSLGHARELYGVVFTGRAEDESLAVDSAATARERASRAK
jgi:N-methylhydantoinase B